MKKDPVDEALDEAQIQAVQKTLYLGIVDLLQTFNLSGKTEPLH